MKGEVNPDAYLKPDSMKLRSYFGLIIALFIYFVTAIVLIGYFQYDFGPGADGICYLSIAQKYALGNFEDAVNGYWSPLFSWLLVPFLLKGFSQVSALKSAWILSIIIGSFNIIGMYFLTFKFKINQLLRTFFIFSLIPVTLCFVFFMLTSDLLMSSFLIFYLNFIFDPKYQNNLTIGLFCGLTGGLAYLSKSFAFPFFLVHYLIFNAIYYFKKYKKNETILKNLLIGLTVFFLIAGAWSFQISEKYGYLTIGTSGTYNYNALGPDIQLNHPMNMFGIVSHPNPTAITPWEDPSYVKLYPWSPFDSIQSFTYQVNIFIKNIVKSIFILFTFSPLILPIIILSILMFFKSPNKQVKWAILCLMVTFIIFILGYLPFFVDLRYFYFLFYLVIFLGFYLIKVLNENYNIENKIFNTILVLFFIFLILSPTITLINYSNNKAIYTVSENLKDEYKIQGNIASDSLALQTLHLSYYLDSPFYGSTDTYSQELEKGLEENDIDYYLVWNPTKKINLAHYKEINPAEQNLPRIFKHESE